MHVNICSGVNSHPEPPQYTALLSASPSTAVMHSLQVCRSEGGVQGGAPAAQHLLHQVLRMQLLDGCDERQRCHELGIVDLLGSLQPDRQSAGKYTPQG